MAASHTTNLNLNKPARTDGVSVISDLNDNMDIIDQAYGEQNQNIANVNSNSNSTKDILADALNCTKTTFFNGAGSSYTGTVPDMNYKWATFLVNVKGTIKTVIAHKPENKIAINTYDNGAWSGWEELALNDQIAKYTYGSATVNTNAYGNGVIINASGKYLVSVMADDASIIITPFRLDNKIYGKFTNDSGTAIANQSVAIHYIVRDLT